MYSYSLYVYTMIFSVMTCLQDTRRLGRHFSWAMKLQTGGGRGGGGGRSVGSEGGGENGKSVVMEWGRRKEREGGGRVISIN